MMNNSIFARHRLQFPSSSAFAGKLGAFSQHPNLECIAKSDRRRSFSSTPKSEMRKVLSGIKDFRTKFRDQYKEKYAHLALGQKPDSLLIACSDSRVGQGITIKIPSFFFFPPLAPSSLKKISSISSQPPMSSRPRTPGIFSTRETSGTWSLPASFRTATIT